MIVVNTVINDLEETPIAAGVADLARNSGRRLRVIHTLGAAQIDYGDGLADGIRVCDRGEVRILIGSGNTDFLALRRRQAGVSRRCGAVTSRLVLESRTTCAGSRPSVPCPAVHLLQYYDFIRRHTRIAPFVRFAVYWGD